MRNNINLFFLFSLSIHFIVLLFIASVFSHPTFITLPVEVSFYSSPVPAEKAVSRQQPVKKVEKKVAVKKEKAEIIVPAEKK
ncbi:hypothetical protein ACFL58_02170 [Elusimicrobiota bacterium]